MIIVTHKYSNVMKQLDKIPSPLKYESVLIKNYVFTPRKFIYGEIRNIIWVYDNIHELGKLKLKDYKDTLILICDIFIFYAVIFKLKELGVGFNFEDIKPVDKEKMIEDKYRVSNNIAHFICQTYKYNLKSIKYNDTNISLFLTGNNPLINNNNDYTYYDILLYVCGKNNITYDEYIQVVSKYHYSKTHLVKYLRKYLRMYIDLYIGVEMNSKSTSWSNDMRIVKEISEYLTIEKAFYMYYKYETYTCSDLLGG